MSLNASSIKTRIETVCISAVWDGLWNVLTPLPLKQGLKLFFPFRKKNFRKSLNASSIKTRIETFLFSGFGNSRQCLNASSIKTRIETQSLKLYSLAIPLVLTPLPLKQGLKLYECLIFTGSQITVLTPLPLKQGLKPGVPDLYLQSQWVLTPLPLKQGLKRELNRILNIGRLRLNASSIKTRIETRELFCCLRVSVLS